MVTRSRGALDAREPTASMVGKEDEMTPASKATASKKVPASRSTGAALAAAVERDAGTFFEAVALLAGVISSSFPTIEAVGSLASSAPRERVTIADCSKGGNSAAPQVKSGEAL